jgi:hypothetical protein
MKNSTPDPINHINKFVNYLKNDDPFTFIRFSDGETEILRNRYLQIGGGKIVFRGNTTKNIYPEFDSKKYDPSIHQNIRHDLLQAVMFRAKKFYKGIPTAHNRALEDREFMLRLNGGFTLEMTFADLFLNSNYQKYLTEVVPLFENYKNIYIIANFRAKPRGLLSKAKHIKVGDNFFADYDKNLDHVMSELANIENGSLVLSSASSLTKIVGHKLFLINDKVTFLDIGTSINHLLSLDDKIRDYHKKNSSFIKKILNIKDKGYEIKW